MAAMKTITRTSRHLILAALTASLLASWSSVNASNNTNTTDSTALTQKSLYAAIINKSIWEKISSDFSIDHKATDKRVQGEIHKLLSNRKHFTKVLKDAAPYIYYIYQQTQAYDLPSEIALIPFIESEFKPANRSPVGALGLWQLMPGTARELGVKVTRGYDGRRNVIDSTDAALRYFHTLGQTFNNNWHLAIAAYNAGPGRVSHAKKRAGSSNFFMLPLPRETRLYVPRLLAVAEIIAHPNKYNVQLPPVLNQPYFSKVTIEKPATLNSLARKSGIELKKLRTLNPDVRPGMKTPVIHGKRSVLVPIEKVTAVKS